MLDIQFIRDNADAVKENCKNRHVDVNIDDLIALDDKRREGIEAIEELRAMRNKGSKGKPSPEEIEEMKKIGEQIKSLEEKHDALMQEYLDLLTQVPNMTHPESPIGGEEDFVEREKVGEPTQFDFDPKNHEDLLTEGDMLDFVAGAKVAGSKFYYIKNDLVQLNRALVSYAMDIAVKHGYQLMETPEMVRQEILEASGFNPRGEESQIYDITGHDLHLIGTAEIPVLGYHAGETLDLTDGPKKYVAFSQCYRTEGGAYGRESKGLYRVHQFAKLEMFIFCTPEQSEELHQELLAIEKEILDGLKLAYRVIDIPTGDLGGPAYRKYDIEAWMPMKEGYGEITSASNCTDYQARRLQIKYKNQDGAKGLVHTLNGTAVALSRLPIAVVEQYQQKDGTIRVPDALQPYMGGKAVIGRK